MVFILKLHQRKKPSVVPMNVIQYWHWRMWGNSSNIHPLPVHPAVNGGIKVGVKCIKEGAHHLRMVLCYQGALSSTDSTLLLVKYYDLRNIPTNHVRCWYYPIPARVTAVERVSLWHKSFVRRVSQILFHKSAFKSFFDG